MIIIELYMDLSATDILFLSCLTAYRINIVNISMNICV